MKYLSKHQSTAKPETNQIQKQNMRDNGVKTVCATQKKLCAINKFVLFTQLVIHTFKLEKYCQYMTELNKIKSFQNLSNAKIHIFNNKKTNQRNYFLKQFVQLTPPILQK